MIIKKKSLRLLLLISFFSITGMTQNSNLHYLITGTYTGGKSEGIYVFEFNSKDGSFRAISHIISSNPTFLAVSPDEKYVYAANENSHNDNGGEVSSFSFDKKTGKLTAINKQLSGGDAPCYLQTNKTGQWLAVGNYGSGTVSILPVNASGELEKASVNIQHQGKGINNQRQERAHVHCTTFSTDDKWLFAPDLGIDKVMIYAFDAATGKLEPAPQPFVKIKDGGGPRHLTFHPNHQYAYLMEEMGGAVDVFQYKNGTLKHIQRIPSVQNDDKGFVGSADIHISKDGKFLYASNRGGFNTIAIYKINAPDGTLTLIDHQPTLGDFPRNFIIDPSGNYLLAANQNSDNIVIFKRDIQTGLLTDTGKRIEVGKPVCLKWIRKE